MEDLPFVKTDDTWISLGVTKVKLELTIDELPFVKKGDTWISTWELQNWSWNFNGGVAICEGWNLDRYKLKVATSMVELPFVMDGDIWRWFVYIYIY